MNKLVLKLPDGTSIKSVDGLPTSESTSLSSLIQLVVTFMFIGASILALFFLIWGGIQWIVSGGDKTAVEAARKRVTYSLLGLIVVFFSYFIVNLIGNFFGVKLLGT